MKRRAFRILTNGLTIISLLLCVGTCVLWYVALHSPFGVSRFSPDGRIMRIEFGSNAISIETGEYSLGIPPILGWPPPTRHFIDHVVWMDHGCDRELTGARFFSIELEHLEKPFADYVHSFTRKTVLPLWWLADIFIAPPSISFIRALLRRQRFRGRLCVECNYDLRATPGRCPECGAVPSTKGIA